jgi:cyclopropane-fatty-acyl-phospholipid synthase
MLKSERIRVDIEGGSQKDIADNAEFVVAAPRLLTILRLLAGPDFWVGETFIQGHWYLLRGNLADFLDAIEKEARRPYRAYYNFLTSTRWFGYYLRQYFLNKRYTRKVKRHYDVDSAIYEMILDDEMLYTCAFFANEATSLASAQQNKIATTIDRMSLPRGAKRVLDIGCGWGAMARAITRRYDDAQVCGLSISAGQIDWAKQKDREVLSISQADRIEYRLEDYVSHADQGRYDGIAVIGMIEHVGLGGYSEFFLKIHELLKPGGTAVVHTIVSPLPAVPTNSWIDRHIFTGGYTPSISELLASAEKPPFHIVGVHVHGPSHYRRTIECWLSNFSNNVGSVGQLLAEKGCSESQIDVFIRTWTFYLSAVRNMFDDDDERTHQVVQLVVKRLDLDKSPQHDADSDAHREHGGFC